MTCQDVIFDYTLLIALCVVKILFTRRHDCAYQWYWFECWRNPESLSRSWAWFEDEFSATRSCLPWMDIERERESLSRGRKRNLNYYLQPYYCSLRKAQNDHMIALYQIKTPISRCKILSKLAVGEQAQIHSSVLARTFALRHESLIAEISKSIEHSDVKLGIQTCCYYIFQLTKNYYDQKSRLETPVLP